MAGAPIANSLLRRALPGALPVAHVVYAPLYMYAWKSELPGASWYRSYWVLCDHQVAKYV
jgi:hypothetical protein